MTTIETSPLTELLAEFPGAASTALLHRPPVVSGAKRPVIYGRISQDRTGAGIKVAHQVAECKCLAQKLDLPNPDVLGDNDMSAYSGKPRPGFEELVEGLTSGRWNVLIIWHTDRLYRRLEDLVRLVRAVEAMDVEVHTVMGGKLDLGTAEGRMLAGFLGVFAEFECDHRSDRVVNGSRGTVYRARNGKAHGGGRRYGFACTCSGPHEIVKFDAAGNEVVTWHRHLSDLELAAEQAVVKWLTDEVVKGARTGALARQLRQEGVPAPRGGRGWEGTLVKQLVLRPANAGLVLSTAGQGKGKRTPQIVRDDQGVPVPGQWDAIVSVAAWETAMAILTDPARGRYYGHTPVSLLAGIGRCWCGQAVQSGARDRYVSRCNHLKRSRGKVDDLVRRVVVGVLATNKVEGHDTTVAIDNSAEIAKLGQQLMRLQDLLADELLTVDEFRRQRDRKAGQIAELERQQRVSRAPGVLYGVTAESFGELSLDRQRAVVAELLDVRLLPAAGGPFDPKTVLITPRQVEQAA